MWARVGTNAPRSGSGHLCRLDVAQDTNGGQHDETHDDETHDDETVVPHVSERWSAGETLPLRGPGHEIEEQL
jgi:hypothetical protein